MSAPFESKLKPQHLDFVKQARAGERLTAADRSPSDNAYGIVVFLSVFSFLAAPVLFAAYLVAVNRAWRAARQPAAGDSAQAPETER